MSSDLICLCSNMPWIIINNSQLEAFVLQDQWTNIEKKKTIFNQLKLIGF